MRNRICSFVTLAMLAAPAVARAQANETMPPEPAAVPATPGTNETVRTTTKTTIVAEPMPAAVAPESCPPPQLTRVDKDQTPGRNQRIGGAVMIGFGLGAFIAGTTVAAWAASTDAAEWDGSGDRDLAITGGAITAVMGGLTAIGGIPLLSRGIRMGRDAASPTVVLNPTGNRDGASAKLVLRY